jgi:nucleotide-binding universal stress UspA family protein
MFKSILFPTDGSELSEKATATAVQFAALNHARIVGITVVQPIPVTPISDVGVVVDVGDFAVQMQEAAREHIDKLAAAAQIAGVPFEGIISTSTVPFEEIIEASKKFNCDIIIMATHGHTGLDKFLLGSQTDKVLSNTTLPVLVLR